MAWTPALLQSVFGLLDDRLEGGLVGDSKISQQLSVHRDTRLLQHVDEPAVTKVVLTTGRIDTGNPKGTKDALTIAPVTVGILTRSHNRLLSHPKDIVATSSETFGKGNNFL